MIGGRPRRSGAASHRKKELSPRRLPAGIGKGAAQVKQSYIRLFAFRPEDYRAMEEYLQQQADQGWKLRWCRGILAGFGPREEENLRYAVDPHAATGLSYLRRYPKRRLRERMKEGWFSVGSSHGCQILCTAEEAAPHPVTESEEVLRPLIRGTCRLASMLWVLALLALAWFLSSKKAVVYAVLLTNLYLAVGLLAAFLVGYHAVNAILLSRKDRPAKDPRICRRYLVHAGGLLLILLAAAALLVGGRNDMLLYLALPILVAAGGLLLLRTLSVSGRDRQKLFPLVIVLSVLMFGMILFANRQMSTSSRAWSVREREELLAQADSLPVLRLSDCGLAGDAKQAVQTNRSLLGSNLLYAEQAGEDYIFTNCTVMRSQRLAQPIFDYLYDQAQKDFNEEFAEFHSDGLTYYVLEKANGCLFQDGDAVYFFTAPSSLPWQDAAASLIQRLGECL